jgi:hypothetical protein
LVTSPKYSSCKQTLYPDRETWMSLFHVLKKIGLQLHVWVTT